MFERDKEELRSLGVPIEVGSMDAYFDDEPGYRIRADQFALPDIALSADEAAVVGLATRVWQHARLADADHGGGPQARPRSASTSTCRRSTSREPRLGADEPSFDVFWEARRSARRSSSTTAARRPADHPAPEPWGVVR